ncbi:hypothetical protein HDU91_003831 [Kappamyces sp. JEL0680]|nr:hypothetical protein HDU91_003831 [Kappamyces sp. JEL0680]
MCYSLYSFPNMFLPVFGGHYIDHYDPKKVLFALSLVICVGQTLFAVGVYLRDPRIIILGRLVFGIGGESASVSTSAIVTSWFQLGSVANSILSPKISNYFSSPLMAVCFGTVVCYLSFLSALLLIGIMAVAENTTKNAACQEQTPLLQSFSTQCDSPRTSTFLEKKGMLYEIRHLPASFWILCVLCILLYGTVIPFNATASDFLMSKWYHGDIETAGVIMRYVCLADGSIPDLISFFIVPCFGYIIDTWGHRISWLLVCSLMIGTSHMVMGLSRVSPVPSMIMLGLAYAIYGVVLWPSIATAVQYHEKELQEESEEGADAPPPVKLLGTAFGLSVSFLNTALTAIPLIAAQIRIQSQTFIAVELFYSSLAFLGFVSSLILMVVDVKGESILQRVSHNLVPPTTLSEDTATQLSAQEALESVRYVNYNTLEGLTMPFAQALDADASASSVSSDEASDQDNAIHDRSPQRGDGVSFHSVQSILSRGILGSISEPQLFGTSRFIRIAALPLRPDTDVEVDQVSIE